MRKSEKFVSGVCSILEKHKVFTAVESRDAKKLFEADSADEFDNFLLQEGLVSKEDLLKALSDYYKVPSFDVIGHFFDHQLVKEFPRDFLIRNEIIPLEEQDDTMLFVIAANPADESLLTSIGVYNSCDIQFYVGLAEDIRESVEEFYDASLQVTDDYDYIDAEEEDEARALDQERKILDREEE